MTKILYTLCVIYLEREQQSHSATNKDRNCVLQDVCDNLSTHPKVYKNQAKLCMNSFTSIYIFFTNANQIKVKNK